MKQDIPTTINEYINSCPPEIQHLLRLLRDTIKGAYWLYYTGKMPGNTPKTP